MDARTPAPARILLETGVDARRWQQIEDLFHAVLGAVPQRRGEVLIRGAGDDGALRAEVETLLAAHARGSSILDAPAFDVAPRGHAELTPPIAAGERIDKYTLREIIGHGGMGVVYEAEQASPRRIVALKVMRALPYLDELTARLFEREGRALARLTHPGIATIYEAGRSADGWFYFAMERVAGVPLTQFAHERKLSIRERLELFARVCEAVHYAHQRGVIHRDLKPSNILVADSGQPKILDFGLARIMDTPADQTSITLPGAFHGTLAYASPEQARSGSDIDIRSDVYSLGLILYELLTDRLPYELAGLTLPEAARRICEQPPTRPAAVRRALRGELDTILSKALEKEPARRYASVSQFASDVTRFLRNEPIAARPASSFYQLRKLALRHKAPFVLAAALLLALVSFAVVAAIQALRISTQRDNALAAQRREAKARQQAEEVADFFLRDLFEVTDPQKAQVEKLTARELLDRGAQRIEQRFAGQPETQATLMLSMGRVYAQLGLLPSAREIMQSALSLRRQRFGDEHADTAAARFYLGRVLRKVGEPEPAEKLQLEALDVRRRLFGAHDVAVAESLDELGTLRKGRAAYQEAAEYVEQAIAIYRERCGEVSGEVASCLDTLSRIRNNQAQFAESTRLAQESLAMSRKVYGDKHPTTVSAMSNLARITESIPLFEESLSLWRALRGDESLEAAQDLEGIGGIQFKRGDLDNAGKNWRLALDIRRKLQGSVNADVATVLESLARIHSKAFQVDEAEGLIRESFDIRRQLYQKPSEQEIYAWCDWATRLYLEEPDYDEADRLTREGYAVAKQFLRDDNIFAVYCQHWRGVVLFKRGEYDEAENLLRESLERNRRILGADHAGVAEFSIELATLLNERGKPDEAEVLLHDAKRIFEQLNALNAFGWLNENIAQSQHARGDYEAAEESYRRALDYRLSDYGKVHPLSAICTFHFAELLHDRGDFDAARPLYEEALAVLQQFLKPCHPDVLTARVDLGKLFLDLGELSKAEAALRDALRDQIGVLGENHPHVARTKCLLGGCLITEGSRQAGEQFLARGLEQLHAVYPRQHRYVREAASFADAPLSHAP